MRFKKTLTYTTLAILATWIYWNRQIRHVANDGISPSMIAEVPAPPVPAASGSADLLTAGAESAPDPASKGTKPSSANETRKVDNTEPPTRRVIRTDDGLELVEITYQGGGKAFVPNNETFDPATGEILSKATAQTDLQED